MFAVSDPTLIAAKSVWKYLDNGSDQGTAWRNAGFDDSAWTSGAGILGYGSGDEANGRFATGRTPVEVPDYLLPSHVQRRQRSRGDGSPVALQLKDGAAVYVNGVEVARPNMPAGTITSQTYASTNVSSPADRTWSSIQVPPSVLTTGTNTIAIEVHKNFRSSSSLALDVQLIAAF